MNLESVERKGKYYKTSNINFVDKVDNWYITGKFKGKAAANNGLKVWICLHFFTKRKIKVSADIPNINIKLFEMSDEKKKKNSNLNKLISIGTCGLHTLFMLFKVVKMQLDGT